MLGTGQALDTSLNTLISSFKELNDEPTIFESCATPLPLKPHEGVSKLINNYNRMTAVAVADAVDISQMSSLSDTQTSVTPGEIAVQTWLPGSTMRRAADPQLLQRTSRILMNALKLKQDQAGGLQLVNFVPVIAR